MDQQRLDAIRARVEAATKGPWELTKDGRYEDHDECRINLPNDTIELCSYENGEFIAHARTDVPDLLAEVARLTAELIAAKRDLRHADNCDICAHAAAPGSCDLECDECKRGCFCRDCRDENLWQWRGPTENRGQPNE